MTDYCSTYKQRTVLKSTLVKAISKKVACFKNAYMHKKVTRRFQFFIKFSKYQVLEIKCFITEAKKLCFMINYPYLVKGFSKRNIAYLLFLFAISSGLILGMCNFPKEGLADSMDFKKKNVVTHN